MKAEIIKIIKHDRSAVKNSVFSINNSYKDLLNAANKYYDIVFVEQFCGGYTQWV